MDKTESKGVRGSLLVVDDDFSARQTMEAFLTREGYEVRCAPNGQTALMFAMEDPPELILLDVRMPDMGGIEVCRRLREDRRTRDVPVIFISGMDEVADKVKGLEAGGVDYITKPFQTAEVLARVETHLTLSRLQKQVEAQNVQLEQEIVKSKSAEEKIRQAAEEWRATFDSIKDLISIHDKDFRIVRANKAFADAFGMEFQELLGKRCYEVIHGADKPMSHCPYIETLDCQKAVREEYLEPRLGKYLEVTTSPICNDKKELIGTVHVAKDITERKQAEDALRRSEERFRNLVETTADWVWEIDANGVYTYVSPRVRDLLGYETEEVLGKTPADLMPPDEAKRISSIFGSIKAQGTPFSNLENTNRHRDGRPVVLETSGVPFFDTGGALLGYRGIDRDITERKRAEEALRRAHDELEERVKERTAELALANEQLIAAAKALEERLRFERLSSDVSVRFMMTSPSLLDLEIECTLMQVREFLKVDRCFLGRLSEDKATWRITHAAFADGLPPIPVEADFPASWFPWVFSRLLSQREVMALTTLEDLPIEASIDKQSLQDWGIRSCVYVPLTIGGSPDYFLTITDDRHERFWPEENIRRLHPMGEIIVHALELAQSRLQLEKRLDFESLLAEISGRFINLAVDQVEKEMKDAQRRICELLHIDRSTLWLLAEDDPETLRLVHIHPAPESPSVPDAMNARDAFPWSMEKIMSGEVVKVSKMADLPPEAARDLETWQSYGTKSTVVLPLSAGEGKPFGALSFAMTREEREFPEAGIRSLQLIAQVFANALERKRAEEALRLSEERLSMAADSAQIGLWGVDLSTRRLWNSGSSWELLGLDRNVDLTEEVFFSLVYSDDRERLSQTMEEGGRSGTGAQIEYRIVQPDGRVRWLSTYARPHFNDSGEPIRLTGVSVDITERKLMEEQRRNYLEQIEQLKERLQHENIYLQEEIKLLVEHSEIVGQSLSMKKVLTQAAQVAQTESTVLLLGETGTGKELVARAIHRMSVRKERPLVTVNCASLPPTLIESELFGRERGAYTGALTKLIGRFEIADGSTLFLDEIGEFPFELQSKLLRFLETGNFERLGSTKSVHVDARIIAATNRDLSAEVTAGKFRRDLFYRLNIFPILLPPLRDRPEDIPALVWSFVNEFQKRMGKEIDKISKKSMETLQSYSWPGNVRELRNVVERAMIVNSGRTLVIQTPELTSSEIPATAKLEDTERNHIMSVLERTGWRVGGRGGAAEVLGLNRSTLYSKMKKLGIVLKRPTF